MDVARAVRRWRKRAGLSQEEVARRIGTHQPQIARIERGEQAPRVDTLQAILEACGAELRVEARRAPVTPPPAPEPPATRPQMRVLQQLAFRRVRCVIIGSLAERLHGADVPAPGPVLICAMRDPVNRRRLSLVRRSLRPPLRRAALLRVRFEPPFPFPSYRELEDRAAPTSRIRVPVAALDDLIEARRTPREPGAREALELLLRIREARRAPDR